MTPAPVGGGGRVLTFYSYKGGTGRSMAMANIAWILACEGKRVLMIDWDLEAPGLHRYFRPFLIDDELSSSEGLLDMVDRYASRAVSPSEEGAPAPPADWYLEYADYSDYLLSINFKQFSHGGRLDLLPAGRQGEAYAVKVNSFNWQNLYDRLGGGGFFEAVKARAVREYDYVLIDSRTGVSDTAGICSVQMPDTLVVCFTYNNQSIKGAASVARSAVQRRQRLVLEESTRRAASPDAAFHDSPKPYRVFAVPMRVDASESDRLALRQAFARDSFAELLGRSGIANPADYWGRVEVPYISFYAYEEVLAAFKDDARDPKTVLSALVRLTAYLTDGAVGEYRLPIAPEEKQSLLERFAETPLTAASRAALADRERETEEEVLVRHADAAIAALSDEDRVLARRVFGRLVRLASKEEGGGILPIRVSIGDFAHSELRVISTLADRQVLRIMTEESVRGSSRAPGQAVSFEDARIVRLWKPLLAHLDGDREFLLWRQQVRHYMADWERSGRDASALLSGALLTETGFWRQKRPDDLNPNERDYLDRSVRRMTTVASATAARSEATDAARPHDTKDVGRDTLILPRADERLLRPSASSPGPYRSRRWLGLALTATAVVVVAAGSATWLSRSLPGSGPRADVILAAAAATTDPLERTLLLLELGDAGNDRRPAADLALQAASRPLPYAVLPAGDRPPTTVRFTSDGSGIVAGFDDGSVRVWRNDSFQTPTVVRTRVGAVVSAAVDGNVSRILVTGRNNIAEMWDLANKKQLTTRTIASNLLEGTLTDDLIVMAHREGRTTSSPGGTLVIGQFPDLSTARSLAEMKLAPRALVKLPDTTSFLVFSGDGRWGAAASDEALSVWELPSGRVLLQSKLVPRRVPADGTLFRESNLLGLLVSPTGAYVAAVTTGEVLIWSIGSSQKEPRRVAYTAATSQAPSIRQSPRESNEVTFALSPDGETTAIAYSDGSIRLRRSSGDTPLLTEPSPAITRAMAFSPDGSFLAAAGGDGTTRIWQTPTGAPTPPVSTDWSTLSAELRARTTACLSPQDRTRLLGEAVEAAQAAADSCENTFGLKYLGGPRAAR